MCRDNGQVQSDSGRVLSEQSPLSYIEYKFLGTQSHIIHMQQLGAPMPAVAMDNGGGHSGLGNMAAADAKRVR